MWMLGSFKYLKVQLCNWMFMIPVVTLFSLLMLVQIKSLIKTSSMSSFFTFSCSACFVMKHAIHLEVGTECCSVVWKKGWLCPLWWMVFFIVVVCFHGYVYPPETLLWKILIISGCDNFSWHKFTQFQFLAPLCCATAPCAPPLHWPGLWLPCSWINHVLASTRVQQPYSSRLC